MLIQYALVLSVKTSVRCLILRSRILRRRAIRSTSGRTPGKFFFLFWLSIYPLLDLTNHTSCDIGPFITWIIDHC